MTADKQVKLAARRLAAAEGISYAAARRRLREASDESGIALPYGSLRELVPVLPAGHLAVLASRTSAGKTTMAVDIARHAAAGGFSVLVCCFHETDRELGVRMLSGETGIPHQRLVEEGFPDERAARAVKEHVQGWPLRFFAPGHGVERGWDKVLAEAEKYTPDLLVVDDLHSMMSPLDRADQGLMAAAADRVRAFAEDHRAAVLVCSQLDMRAADRHPRPQGLPREADVPYRSSFWQRARIGMLLHRPEQVPDLVHLPRGEVLDERPGEADVFVLRGRAVGTATVGAELDRYRFTDIGRPAARRLPWRAG